MKKKIIFDSMKKEEKKIKKSKNETPSLIEIMFVVVGNMCSI